MEPPEGKLVSILELSVGCTILLNCVVCKVNKRIIYVLQVNSKFRTTGAKITFGKKVQVLLLSKKNPYTDIKLSFVNQKRLLDILLNYECVKLDFVLNLPRSSFGWRTSGLLASALFPNQVERLGHNYLISGEWCHLGYEGDCQLVRRRCDLGRFFLLLVHIKLPTKTVLFD